LEFQRTIQINVQDAQQTPKLDYWERIGETTRWGRYLAVKERALVLRGLALAGPPGKAVDMGCGGGRWGKILADHGWEMTCVDVSAEALGACQAKMPSARCICVEPTSTVIPCETRSQRLLMCMEAPDVVEPPWFAPEAGRVLQDSGHLIGFYMNPQSWRGVLWRMRRETNGIGGRHYWGPSYQDWKRNLVAQGFEMLHEESYSWAPFGRTSDSRLIPFATSIERITGLSHLVRFAPWILFIARKTPLAKR
jgi:SAM-dependent methyltransferase